MTNKQKALVLLLIGAGFIVGCQNPTIDDNNLNNNNNNNTAHTLVEKTLTTQSKKKKIDFDIKYMQMSNITEVPTYVTHIANRLTLMADSDGSGYIMAVDHLINIGNSNKFVVKINEEDTTGLLWDKNENKFVVSKKWLETVNGQNSPLLGELRDLFNSITAVRNVDALLMAQAVSAQNIRGA